VSFSFLSHICRYDIYIDISFSYIYLSHNNNNNNNNDDDDDDDDNYCCC